MPETKQDIGLAMLAISSNFGSWSAWNSSLFTIRTFVDNKEKYDTAIAAMNLGLITSIAIGAGIYYVYGEKAKVAAWSSIGTGVLLYAAYLFKLKQNPVLAASIKSENSKSQKLSDWKPLSTKDIESMRSTINNYNPIEIVSEP